MCDMTKCMHLCNIYECGGTYTFNLKFKKTSILQRAEPGRRQGSPAAELAAPAPRGRTAEAARSRAVSGGVPDWSRRLRACCACTSSGPGIPHLEGSRRRPAARQGDRVGIFQWGRRLLKGSLSAGEAQGQRGQRGLGVGRPQLVTPRAALRIPWPHVSPEAQREAGSPYSAQRRVLPARGAGSSRPARHRICAQCLCLVLEASSGLDPRWELFVFVAPPPWGLTPCLALYRAFSRQY